MGAKASKKDKKKNSEKKSKNGSSRKPNARENGKTDKLKRNDGLEPEQRNVMVNALDNHLHTQKEYKLLAKSTHFNEDTIRLLHSRFMRIDSMEDQDGNVSFDEFAAALGLKEKSVLVQRIFNSFDKFGMGGLNFRNFVSAISILSPKARPEEKMKFSFSIFDMDGDGKISREELTTLMHAAVQESAMKMSKRQLEQMLQQQFDSTDFDGNGEIEWDEYVRFCKENPRILKPYTIDVEELLTQQFERRKNTRLHPSSSPRDLTHGMNEVPEKKSKLPKFLRKVSRGLKNVKSEVVVKETPSQLFREEPT